MMIATIKEEIVLYAFKIPQWLRGELTEQENKDKVIGLSDLLDFSERFIRKWFCAEDYRAA